jgi:hypothetical protein
MYEYSGAIHIHSLYSDGTGKIEDIAKFADEAGLDFIIMTDHNTLKPKEDGYEKWISNVMVIIGYELNDINNKNHYLVFGLDKVVGSLKDIGNGELGNRLSAPGYVRQVKEGGGIGFLAHPDESRHHLPSHPPYPWTDTQTEDYTGIEIWNHMSEWVEGLNESNKLDRLLHPLKSINAPANETLKRWDRAALSRHVTGIGSVDAHAFKQNILGFFELEVFPYKVLFKSIRTHVLVENEIKYNDEDNFEYDKRQVLDALRKGRCFIANSYYGNAKGFRFTAEFDENVFHTGDTISSKNFENLKLRVSVPKTSIIKLIRNGEVINEHKGTKLTVNTDEPGIYRAECWEGNKGWIFSNHIRLKKE